MPQAPDGASRPFRIRRGRRHHRDVLVPQMKLEHRAAGLKHTIPEDSGMAEAGSSQA
jgi:hypothetical protein